MNQILPETIQVTQQHIDDCTNPLGATSCALHDAIQPHLDKQGKYYAMVFYQGMDIRHRITKTNRGDWIKLGLKFSEELEKWQLALTNRGKDKVEPITLCIDEEQRFVSIQ